MDIGGALVTYFEESRELLCEMEDILLQSEQCQPDDEQLNALFRCAHTIKGSGDMFGLSDVVSFTHSVETLLDKLRNGEMTFNPTLAELLLKCRDHIGALIAEVEQGQPADEQQGALLLAELAAFNPAEVEANAPLDGEGVDFGFFDDFDDEPNSQLQANGDCWHISLRFDADLLMYGLDPLSLVQYLSTMGELVHVETVYDQLPDLFELKPEDCYLGFEIAFKGDVSKQQIEEVFEYVADQGSITILAPDCMIEDYVDFIESSKEDELRLGQLLVACGSITENELEQALNKQAQTESPLGEVLIEQKSIDAPTVEKALNVQKEISEKKVKEAKSVKVVAGRLDSLIDQIGELVIAGAATQLQAKKTLNNDLLESAGNLLRLVEEIRETALSLRMSAVGEVFSRFPRVVRDLSKQLGKDIGLIIEGAECELDKTMIERIGDPLMHLIRNSIDHGIESPEVRAAAGKPVKGNVRLNAYHESGSIVIEVCDDGAGLDVERIRQKAIERGLVSEAHALSDKDIYQLILEPGFSTAQALTNISGRGVGMDVVKSNIEQLRGSLSIDSEAGKGSVFRIYLPLTLAIIDGFQVKLGHSTYILPLESVIECIELPETEQGADYLNVRGELLSYLRLRECFAIQGSQPQRQNIVVVGFGGRKIGIVVDQLLGECQTVIKPLGPIFASVSGISGSTILGSGEVALILDVAQLINQAINRQKHVNNSVIS